MMYGGIEVADKQHVDVARTILDRGLHECRSKTVEVGLSNVRHPLTPKSSNAWFIGENHIAAMQNLSIEMPVQIPVSPPVQ